jgi:hypothetical protein
VRYPIFNLLDGEALTNILVVGLFGFDKPSDLMPCKRTSPAEGKTNSVSVDNENIH